MDKGEENWIFALVEKFEDEAYPMGNVATPIDSLRSLMEERRLKQADLAGIFGGQPVVSAYPHEV